VNTKYREARGSRHPDSAIFVLIQALSTPCQNAVSGESFALSLSILILQQQLAAAATLPSFHAGAYVDRRNIHHFD
jgi:hypothetical protein